MNAIKKTLLDIQLPYFESPISVNCFRRKKKFKIFSEVDVANTIGFGVFLTPDELIFRSALDPLLPKNLSTTLLYCKNPILVDGFR